MRLALLLQHCSLEAQVQVQGQGKALYVKGATSNKSLCVCGGGGAEGKIACPLENHNNVYYPPYYKINSDK